MSIDWNREARGKTPTLTRHEDGHLTIAWGTPNNEMPTHTIEVVPELIAEMVATYNSMLIGDGDACEVVAWIAGVGQDDFDAAHGVDSAWLAGDR